MLRFFATSRDFETKMKLLKKRKVSVYSFFPVDRGNCVCQEMVRDWKDKLSQMNEQNRTAEIERTNFLVCPQDKTGMTHYQIVCKKCGEIQGRLWATDKTLKDFCDFHYMNWTNGKQWFGSATPNISPISEQIGLECTCGQDTRDFRANMTLPAITAARIESENKIGREFNRANSKFEVIEVI